MSNFIKKNISLIIGIFILFQPLLDLITGICIHILNINFTLGIILKMLFLIIIMVIALFIYKKKKLLIPYLIVGIYCLLYIIGMYEHGGLFVNIQNLCKTFYFPLLLISLYSIREEIRISKMTLFTTLFIYLICIFIPTILGIGYKTYEITKAGTLGFYNSANEISGIISILTPIMFIVFSNEKSKIKVIILSLIYLVVILMMGTKTPLLSLCITVFFAVLYLTIKNFKRKNYKPIITTFILLVIATTSLAFIIPKTNFYKNIETHLDYLELDSVFEVFQDKKLVDHFIFSSRLKFLDNKQKLYNKAPTYQKLFGIGYMKDNNKPSKLIEMDYFDIYLSHGLVGFIIYFSIVLPIIYNIFKNRKKNSYESCMLFVSLLLIIFLSFFTGHIITAPSVSIISVAILLIIVKRNKKDLLFSSYNMDIGGIEKALLNLVNRLDYNKYNVTIILEEKKGIFLDKINKEVVVKELKVSNNSNILIRKTTNLLRKYFYKLFNYKTYDFGGCFTTYSYSSSKIALMSSNNTAFFVHSDYRTIYKDEKDFRYFFDTRNISLYNNIIFVSNENKKGFIEIYKDLKNKCYVFNNFIDINEIKKLSLEKINIDKNANHKLLVYVGRLDDSSKKITRQIKLVKEIENLDLWIVGEGPDRKKYEEEVKKYQLENRITFLGKQKNPYKFMNVADYIILTSDYEGFPVTYLEAIALNKNIITTYPTSDDLIDIRDYGKVISKDEKEMVNEVKKILKEKTTLTKIDLEKSQKDRMNRLEKMFDGVI